MNNQNNPSFFENLSSQTPQVLTPTPTGPNKKLLFGILGVFILLASVGAGAFLVQQNQNIRSRAAEPIGVEPGCFYEYTDHGKGYNGTPGGFKLSGTCNGNTVMYKGSSCPTTETLISGPNPALTGAFIYHVVDNRTETMAGGACLQVDYQPSTNPSQGIGVCKCGTTGGDEPGGTPQPPTRVCGDQCSNNAECERSNPNSMCSSAGVCVNKNCPDSTTDGANCSCFESNVQACGEPCGILAGSCATGTTCGFINIDNPAQCQQYETLSGGSQSPRQFCLPTSPNQGYSLVKSCTTMAVNNLAKPDGSITGLTQQDIFSACAPDTPDTTARCVRILVYDTEWNRIGNARLSQLKAGDVVRLSVLGISSGGTIDKARFRINGELQPEVTAKKPGTDEFYMEYTIPQGRRSFRFNAQLHHDTLGWY